MFTRCAHFPWSNFKILQCMTLNFIASRQIALKEQGLPCMYLAHHELESVLTVIAWLSGVLGFPLQCLKECIQQINLACPTQL